MNASDSERRIAVIGGGCSGVLVAIQLLRQAQAPTRVLLFERMTDVGRGVAYGTENHEHLLNVPASRMGAFPDDIGHFQRWVTERGSTPGFPATVAPGDFLPRWIFGEYLRAMLAEARAAAAPGVAFEEIKGEVIDLETETGEVRLRCGDGRAFVAGQVVLALGNLPGEYPIRRSLPIYRSQRYVHVPWRAGVLAGLEPEAEVLIVGAGLTAVDLVLELRSKGHRGLIHALSRRGLLPQVHRAAAPYADFLAGEKLPTTIRALMRRIRAEVGNAAARGIDWRPVLDAIRARTPSLWAGLSWDERARFMRHVRPFWEGHRHRLAPDVAEKIEAQRAAGQVIFYAGRLDKLVETDGGVEARFRSRHTGQHQTVKVGKVINCTGPRSDYSKYQHPLLINLLARGLIGHDPLALGLSATTAGEVLAYDGTQVGWLFTLGAPLKGVLWECTAVPEIRAQARTLAERLLAAEKLPAPMKPSKT
ncbi:MAG: FAD-dependent oxidoreductase [Verrucomicrobia bacterium]|nr:FAD-dependent oxidoreductase [Verrucomicrobiota bacterium]